MLRFKSAWGPGTEKAWREKGTESETARQVFLLTSLDESACQRLADTKLPSSRSTNREGVTPRVTLKTPISLEQSWAQTAGLVAMLCDTRSATFTSP